MYSNLLPYEESEYNKATVPFFILMAIDRYVLAQKGKYTQKAPLNVNYRESVLIYLNVNGGMMEEAMENNHFSNVILDLSVRKQLQHLIVLDRKELLEDINPPQVVTLWLEEEKKRRIQESKKLKIAVIPFGNQKMVEFSLDKGAHFQVTYEKEHMEKGKERALKLLEDAISAKANIIVFPEYVCFQEIQDAIQERLKELDKRKPSRLQELLFVVAGTGWIERDNICSIYNHRGVLLGKQYKYSEYADLKQNKMVENLNNPGKEITLIDIEGIGKTLIGICRDISNRSLIRMLAESFAPQLLLIPAWSSSVNIGFKEQLKEISAQNHNTCSVMCNCCEAMGGAESLKKECGIIVTPYKKGSVVVGKERMICRTTKCIQDCSEGSCIFLIELNFESEAVRQGKMVRIVKKRRK